MSYLDEVKAKVEEDKTNIVESYKTFIDEYVIWQFVDSVGNTATIGRSTLLDENVNPDLFISWLNEEGFIATESANNVYTITYKD